MPMCDVLARLSFHQSQNVEIGFRVKIDTTMRNENGTFNGNGEKIRKIV